MKFSPGDPVWARNKGGVELPLGEHPAVIIGLSTEWYSDDFTPWYDIEVLTYSYGKCICNEPNLRPRRDDYQQHEPRVAKSDLDRILSEPLTPVQTPETEEA